MNVSLSSADADPYSGARELMVERQLRQRGITDERILEAMRQLPRHEFLPPDKQEEAYEDYPVSIGWGQTISQPYMVALMLQLLEPAPENKVLEVGAGSGYVAALLGMLCSSVYAVEIVPELAARARQTLKRLNIHNVHIIHGDGTLGYPAAAPYDRILVSAAAPTIPPPLVEQLAEGGKIVVPVGGRVYQTCEVGTKMNGELHMRRSIECLFVPLRGEYGWKDNI